jgi:prepilin-type N-terminal cleavage/methylation domain-containing protein
MAANDDNPKHAQRRGYTLIELLIVISLMGILAAILLPRFEPSLHDQLQGAAQIIVADLNYARNLAVTNDSQYRVAFKRDVNTYALQHTGTNHLLDVLPLTPYRNAADAPNVQTTHLEDLPRLGTVVEVWGVSTGGGSVSDTGQVEFHSLGGLVGGQTKTIWLAAGVGDARRYQSLTVAPVTGIVGLGTFRASPP